MAGCSHHVATALGAGRGWTLQSLGHCRCRLPLSGIVPESVRSSEVFSLEWSAGSLDTAAVEMLFVDGSGCTGTSTSHANHRHEVVSSTCAVGVEPLTYGKELSSTGSKA